MDLPPLLHLASGSPRRREILTALGLRFTFGSVDIDESPRPGESAENLVVRLAVGKVGAATAARGHGEVVLGADTAVVLGEKIFGKPRSEADAVSMLLCLSGQTHEVLTGVAVVGGSRVRTAVSRTEVRFRDIDPAEAALYWQSGEPRDKAGAYAVQGIGGIFVSRLSGSYSGVVGLPVYETARLLSEAGIEVLDNTGI
jgi:septum formation protein